MQLTRPHRHLHVFDEGNPLAERNTRWAVLLTAMMMLVEIGGGWLFKEGLAHGRDHGHQHREHDHHHHDLNLRSAYLHVVADAATSVLAILALCGGKLWGASWLDPVMAIVGAGPVAVWAYGLLHDNGRVLLDAAMDAPVVAEIHEVIQASPLQAAITDLHVWRIGKGKYACILSLVVQGDASPDRFRRQPSIHEELVHVTVEVNPHRG